MSLANEEIQALIELHKGLPRQGPGDDLFTQNLLRLLPLLPPQPRILDLGCGSGAGTLALAKHFASCVTAVDFSRPFLDELECAARDKNLSPFVKTIEADMGALDFPAGSFDLLWSEGAAYNLTFAGALKAWRPLLEVGGLAVISEMSWFSNNAPTEAKTFWQAAYPAMADEATNVKHAQANGFAVVEMERLPAQAWWDNYYNPLLARMETLRPTATPVMDATLRATAQEIDLFRTYSDAYGYSFYILRAV